MAQVYSLARLFLGRDRAEIEPRYSRDTAEMWPQVYSLARLFLGMFLISMASMLTNLTYEVAPLAGSLAYDGAPLTRLLLRSTLGARRSAPHL